MKKKILAISSLFLLVVIGTVIFFTEDGVEEGGLFHVVRVVDGDTIVVNIEGKDEKVRFIGVDTPESVHNDERKNTVEGKFVSEWVKNLLEGQRVYLEYDIIPRDRFGRQLAYVYLEDKKTMVNRVLLENGFARVMTIQPNVKYADEFYEIQKQAREGRKGFWKTGVFEK